MTVLRRIWALSAGKKTYLAATGLLVLAVALLWINPSDPLGLGMLAVALGLVGVRDHNERKAAAIVQALAELKQEVAARNYVAVVDTVIQTGHELADQANGAK